jgi:N-acetylglutamate synthase-like GNAT family acetyltransferase
MDFSIEEMTMNAWPSIQTMFFDGWIIRMANGYTKRANSINPIYSFENNIMKKIKYCENIYRKNNLPVIFKIIQCDEYKNIDKILDNLDYEKIDLTSVQIHNNIKQIRNIQDGIIVNSNFSDDWKNCFYESNGIKDLCLIKTIETMLENIKYDVIAVHKKENGESIGCGYGVIEREFVGLFDIIVNIEYRNKGYGKEIVEAILSKANENGIEQAHLSVVDNNAFAKKLYGKIGFNEIYKYWYRKKE